MGTCHISNAKGQLKHSFSKSTINKESALFPNMTKNISIASREKLRVTVLYITACITKGLSHPSNLHLNVQPLALLTHSLNQK